jgi:HEAT repeat protein
MAPAILVCGKTLAEQGHKATAAHMLTELSKLSDAPDFLRLSGLLHAIVLKEKDGLAMLRQAIGSDDHEEMAMALRAARLIDAEDATQVALAALDRASARQRALLVILLGDLNTQGSLPVMLEAVKAKEAAVRLAAVTALGSLGSIEHVAILARAAGDEDSAVADAAVGALTELDGEDVDEAVLELLNDAATQKTAIQLIGLRRIESAVDTLLGLLGGPHQTEVVAALGETLALDQLDVLGDRLNSDSDELREAVQAALHAACYRMPDRDATAAKLGEYLDKGKDAVPYVMEELRVLGGKKALEIVAAAANSDDDLLQDYATRELGAWLDTSVAETLLELAKKEGDSKYGIRAIRGYIRLARQFSMPDEEHADICQTALKIASRTPEKKLALEALLRNSNLASLAVAVEAAQEADIKQQATQTARAIAEQISGKRRAVAALLEQLE